MSNMNKKNDFYAIRQSVTILTWSGVKYYATLNKKTNTQAVEDLLILGLEKFKENSFKNEKKW